MKTHLLLGQFLFALGVAVFICASASVNAGGILGDIVNAVVPGAGTTLDNAHRDLKNALPPYKAIEEGASQTVNEAFVQSGAPALQELIARSPTMRCETEFSRYPRTFVETSRALFRIGSSMLHAIESRAVVT